MTDKTDTQIVRAFDPLYSDLVENKTFPTKRPLLAHYTSIESLALIMESDEIWFSNPLFMNDYEELGFWILEGQKLLWSNSDLKVACQSTERHNLFLDLFDGQVEQFGRDHAFDIYVLCFCEHQMDDTDGLLSMWRGYGSDGNGAAIILDSSKLEVVDESPILIANVDYATSDERKAWLNSKIGDFSKLLASLKLPDDKLYLAAHALLHRFKIYSVFTKHRGFHEEQEWRAVYMRELDREDRLSEMLDYAIGKNGLEPKFKFKVGPIDGITGSELSLEGLVHSILLGPSVSGMMSVMSVQRMLSKVGKGELANRLVASSTPYRPTNRSGRA